ncbi:MAG: response regulator [Candidatus Omnitrophota bacterium]|nr:response regulator [Candidatus Omnitrophota bacterium]
MAKPNSSKSQHKVLIVDDEEGIRESLKLILEEHYDLIVVDSGQAALSLVEKQTDIGCVLMDIKMPKINGLDVLKAVKERRPDLPVIMVTGYRSVDTAGEATRLGASGYIVKPFKAAEILESVKRNIK